jgi:GPH family glycoside/pentoside/hexuronide:cation symporter
MADRTPLPLGVLARYAPPGFAQGLLPIIVGSWLMYFYSPPEGEGQVLLLPATIGAIRMAERIIGAVLEPLVGHLSDRTRTRFGRRRPWMALGLPALLLSFVALWFPPAAGAPDALPVVAHLAAALMVFYAAYTAVFAPYNALLPELARSSRERVGFSMGMALFEVLANVAGSAGAAPLVGLGSATVAGIAFANGFQVLAVASAILALISVLPALTLSEPEHPPPDEAFGFLKAVSTSFRNRQFLHYGGLMVACRVASMSAIIAVPYVGTQLMGLDEGQASLLLAVIIVVATLAFPVVGALANRVGKARVFRLGGVGFLLVLPFIGAIGLLPGLPVVAQGGLLFVLAGFPVATLFVLPRALLADIIDHDERLTGARREATYTGMSGVMEKVGEALATGMVGVLFQLFGNSAGQPMGLRLVGAAAAVFVALGLWAFAGYREPA